MRSATILATALALGMMAGGDACAQQPYPNRAIILVVPFSAGGSVDVVGRILAQHMSKTIGQSVVVENITGGGGTIAATRVARAAPDGYTILIGNLGTQVASVGNYKHLPYDPRKDFEPVMLVSATPMVLIVKKDSPAQTLQDFIEYSKSKQQAVAVGSAGVGSISHLTYLLFSNLTKTKTQHVPYRGNPQADTDLIAGRIDAVFDQTILAAPYIRAGSVRALAVTAPHRVATLPDVPTSIEAGLPDLQTSAWNALFVPKSTPQPIIGIISAAVTKALNDEAVVAQLAKLGADAPSVEQRTPEALQQLVNAEFDKWIPLIQAAGVGK